MRGALRRMRCPLAVTLHREGGMTDSISHAGSLWGVAAAWSSQGDKAFAVVGDSGLWWAVVGHFTLTLTLRCASSGARNAPRTHRQCHLALPPLCMHTAGTSTTWHPTPVGRRL